ncbi:MAG: Abortive infection protein [Bacteroidetes bacterium]|nr:MAG: Abortive infection protein [Bacteroidota bacterium]
MFKKIFVHTFLEAEKDSLRLQNEHSGQPERKALIICILTAFSLTCIKYFGSPEFTSTFLSGIGLDGAASALTGWVNDPHNSRINRLAFWVGILNFFYFVIPWIVIRFVFRERVSDYGVKIKGAFKDYWLYALMLLIMLPLVWFFSGTHSFQLRYPFYDIVKGESLWPEFWVWEALYFSQFFTLEFFFRGFMTIGLRRRFGYYSVLVMMIPYCMIHFGKPMPETIGAIIAGLVLGTLSLKSRSIMLGVLIHYSIAITMDLFALWREGFFG